jgi:hypothetical protein
MGLSIVDSWEGGGGGGARLGWMDGMNVWSPDSEVGKQERGREGNRHGIIVNSRGKGGAGDSSGGDGSDLR